MGPNEDLGSGGSKSLKKNLVVFTVDDNCTLPLSVALASIALHSTLVDTEFLVLLNRVKPRNVSHLRNVAQTFGLDCDLVDADVSDFTGWAVPTKHLNVTAYLRLNLTDYVRAHTERILYLDSDVLILTNIERLIGLPLGGLPFGAVASSAGIANKNIGIPNGGDYFNSGVLLLDAKLLVERKLKELWHETYHRIAGEIRYLDQDVVNAACHSQWKRLGVEWNLNPGYFPGKTWRTTSYSVEEILMAQQNPSILHFAGANKPWLSAPTDQYAKLYHKYMVNLSGVLPRTDNFSWLRKSKATIFSILTRT